MTSGGMTLDGMTPGSGPYYNVRIIV
jgi:hypothetical protein